MQIHMYIGSSYFKLIKTRKLSLTVSVNVDFSVSRIRVSCPSESWTIWTKCQTQSKHLPLSPSRPMFVPGSDSGPGWGWGEGRVATNLGPFLGQRPLANTRPTLRTQFRKVRPSGHLGDKSCEAANKSLTRWHCDSDYSEWRRKPMMAWRSKGQKDFKWSDLNSMTENKWMEKCLRKQYQFYKLSGLS